MDVSGQALRWLPALVIVIAASGCDNVEWGGADVRLQRPPPSAVGAAEDSAQAEDTAAFRLPRGPVLYMAERADSLSPVSVVPVGEIRGDSLLPFPSESQAPGYRATYAREIMGEGHDYVLFAGGTRVGRMVTREVVTDESFCTPRPAARGVVELVPEARDVRRFLALATPEGEAFDHGPYQAVGVDRARRIFSLNTAADLIPQVGARWPTSLEAAQGDLQALALGEGTPAFASTFLFRDEMDTSPAEPSSWAMFVLGILQGEEWTPAYVWYREAGREGKGAARYFERLDWDRDGSQEILLEVLGDGARWAAAVERTGGRWQRVYQEPCGAQASPATAEGG